MPKTFHIGDTSVEPGTKKCGRLQVAIRPDGSQIYLPLMIVNGAGNGPVLNAGAGCHGTEYEGPEAIRRWWSTLDPKAFRGVFLGVPVINILAFEAGIHKSWVDQANLNRICPGKPDGSITEKLAYIYINEVVRKADLSMDLHGGGSTHLLGHQVIWRDFGGTEVVQKSLDLAKATGFEYIWKGSGGWGGTITQAALKIGVPAVTVEAGGGGRYTASVVNDYERLLGNVMKIYNMIDGDPAPPAKMIMFQGTFIPCRVGGFYTQTVGLYERVKEGQKLGTIVDLFGEVVEIIKAPFDGIINAERTLPLVHPGDLTVALGEIVEP